MRMRKKKHARERLASCGELVLTGPEQVRLSGGWQGMFKNDAPIHIEIGCGKGAFITEMARRFTDINFVALEKNIDVMVLAAERVRDAELQNVRLALCDAQTLLEWFEPHDVSRIYLNFSDPWPKSGYAKRRLTHDRYLELYRHVMTTGGEIHLKTDNEKFFEFSLEAFERCGLSVSGLTRDLHASEYAKDNVMTEYEAKFTAAGMPIYRCVAAFPASGSEKEAGREDV